METESEKSKMPTYTRQEVSLHKKGDDCWIIVNGRVYDVTNWLNKHPGGRRILQHYGGEDATLAFDAFHNNKTLVRGHLGKFYIGDVVEEERDLPEISQDFLKLKNKMIELGLYKVKPWYYILLIVHIILLELVAAGILWRFGNTWTTWLSAAVCMTISQAQAGWLQHDFGHRSVFNSTLLNSIMHVFTMEWLKGVSNGWWNYRHYQHHAKPNVFLKDPDITIPYVFLLGKVIPQKWGKKHWGKLPYHFQHKYFFLTLPPLLLPIYFHLDVLYYAFRKSKWLDILLMITFYARWHYLFAAALGGFWASMRFYFFVRFLESHWFTWATQISHLPMEIDLDKRNDWFTMQLKGTCNAESGWFADWFLGHLNFQIEHHLFPTMPRHNFQAAQPYVIEFCKEHGIDYQLKPVWTAFGDIIRSLKESGEIWVEAWDMAISVKSE